MVNERIECHPKKIFADHIHTKNFTAVATPGTITLYLVDDTYSGMLSLLKYGTLPLSLGEELVSVKVKFWPHYSKFSWEF